MKIADFFYKEKLRAIAETHAGTGKAKVILAANSFTEAVFFPIPPDILLMAILITGVQRWWYYVLITTATSVLGGIAGYFVGILFYDTLGIWLVESYDLAHAFSVVEEYYAKNAFVAVFISGFTPIPYKVFTIAAGLFRVDFLVFVLASILSRGLRFLIIGYLADRFGPHARTVLYRYFNTATLVLAAFVVLVIVIFL